MPFDGTGFNPAFFVLSGLIDFYATKEKWARKTVNRRGGVCLLYATDLVAKNLGFERRIAEPYMLRAIYQYHRLLDRDWTDLRYCTAALTVYNDGVCRNFDELHDMLRLARLLALHYTASELPPPPNVPHRYRTVANWDAVLASIANGEAWRLENAKQGELALA